MAIVGESGSGKSTVISLVQRFYDPHAGEVLIDGVNIKTLRLDWIRGKIGLVSQEPLLFMTSVKDNITYGKEDATMEEIRRAAELANAANFIDKLPDVRNKSSNTSIQSYIFCLGSYKDYHVNCLYEFKQNKRKISFILLHCSFRTC
jgi:ABC-type multidrug transport system fused ATPase/permease subunit